MAHRNWATVPQKERDELRSLMLDRKNILTNNDAARLININSRYFRYYVVRDLALKWVKAGSGWGNGFWREATEEERKEAARKIADTWYKKDVAKRKRRKSTKENNVQVVTKAATRNIIPPKVEEVSESDILAMLKESTETMRVLREQNEKYCSDLQALSAVHEKLRADAEVWKRSHIDLTEDRARQRKLEQNISFKNFKEEHELAKKQAGLL